MFHVYFLTSISKLGILLLFITPLWSPIKSKYKMCRDIKPSMPRLKVQHIDSLDEPRVESILCSAVKNYLIKCLCKDPFNIYILSALPFSCRGSLSLLLATLTSRLLLPTKARESHSQSPFNAPQPQHNCPWSTDSHDTPDKAITKG